MASTRLIRPARRLGRPPAWRLTSPHILQHRMCYSTGGSSSSSSSNPSTPRLAPPPPPFDVAASPHHPLQIYLSTTRDPYANLAIEHFLLQTSHPESTVLMLYRNAASVVIGRNQNPWVEADLAALRSGLIMAGGGVAGGPAVPVPAPVPLVRRRSGGGAVFHDAGNVNWSVICPPPAFDRDKHAAMVVRALAVLGVSGARVNDRHDIVMRRCTSTTATTAATSTSSSSITGSDGDGGGGGNGNGGSSEAKISGSAYKLTRLRSLHHGTCLLSSPHLGRISRLLRSPAEPYIKARGVESVRSPIANVERDPDDFVDAVVDQFEAMYRQEATVRTVGDGQWEDLPELRKGYDELKSLEWIYGQTPQFTFSTHPTEADSRVRPEPPSDIPPQFRASFTVRHGKLQNIDITGLAYRDSIDSTSQDVVVSQALVGEQLHEIRDWTETLSKASPMPLASPSVGNWLNTLFGLPPNPDSR